MAYSFVRENAIGTTTSYTITAAANGNTLILVTGSFRSPAARTISSLSCTNVTWTKIGNQVQSTVDAEIWLGIVSGGSSGTTITLTMSGSGSTVVNRAYEFSGGLTSGTIIDGTSAGNNASSTTPSLASYSPTSSGQLRVGVAAWANGTAPSATPGGNWTLGTHSANGASVSVQFIYDLICDEGNASASWTITSANWGTEHCTLRVPLPPATWTPSFPDYINDKVGVVPI